MFCVYQYVKFCVNVNLQGVAYEHAGGHGTTPKPQPSQAGRRDATRLKSLDPSESRWLRTSDSFLQLHRCYKGPTRGKFPLPPVGNHLPGGKGVAEMKPDAWIPLQETSIRF